MNETFNALQAAQDAKTQALYEALYSQAAKLEVDATCIGTQAGTNGKYKTKNKCNNAANKVKTAIRELAPTVREIKRGNVRPGQIEHLDEDAL